MSRGLDTAGAARRASCVQALDRRVSTRLIRSAEPRQGSLTFRSEDTGTIHSMENFLDGIAASPKLLLIPLALLVLGVLGYFVNRGSARTSRRSLALAERQEVRREAALDVRLISATCRIDDEERKYVYDIVIRNPSDRPNSIAEAELWIEYEVGGSPVTVKARWRPSQTDPPTGALTLPLALAANGSVAGSLQITVARAILEDRAVDRLRLVLTDTFGTDLVVPSEFVQEQVTRIEEPDGPSDD